MSTAEEKHTEVMVAIGNLTTRIDESVMPAVDQTWVNKDKIIVIENNATNNKDNKSRLISYAAIILSFAMTVLSWVKLNKIH